MYRKWHALTAAIALATFLVLPEPVSVDTNSEPQARGNVEAPAFQIDPLWPKPLPNHWILGSVTGVSVDAQDHIWLVHRGADSLNSRTEMGLATDPPTAEACCAPAPPVLEFDSAGNLLSHWGGPGQSYDWPQSPGGIAVDSTGNVWIAATDNRDPTPAGARTTTAGEGTSATGTAQAAERSGAAQARPRDAHVLKLTRTGALVLQIGKAGNAGGSDSTTGFNRPARIGLDEAAKEVYVADGFANHRVVVFDATTGAYKRHWGAYGLKPDDASSGPYDPGAAASRQFNTVSCVRIAKDGLVYVCDRRNDRIQVFQKDGKFLKETVVAKATLGEGAVWDIAFSADPQQRFLYVADGQNQKVWVLRRDTLEAVSTVGAGGRWPGHFYGVGSIAVDSKGNIYTGETYEGKRLQKFLFKGVGATGRASGVGAAKGESR